ncbi:MAG: hypothetical protein Q4F29_08515 [Lachnospiraceae bacterium]|nr:hypothetical protein [Lachnospiraceae bacterium]
MRHGKYEDIIKLPHPTSRNHPRMSMQNRAAQFSPFAALTGYGAVIKETARLTDRRIELDEYEKAALDEKLQMLREQTGRRTEITVTYFLPDQKKSGGAYIEVTGQVKKTDEYTHTIVMEDGTGIPMDEILEIEIQ